MPSAIAGSGDRRRLSNGSSTHARLPWLGRQMPGDFVTLEDVDSPHSASTDDPDKISYRKRRAGGASGHHTGSQPSDGLRQISTPKRPVLPRRPSFARSPTPSHVDADGDELPPRHILPLRPTQASGKEGLGLSQAVTDLERLMQEAVQVAIDAAEYGHDEEVTTRLRRASDITSEAPSLPEAQRVSPLIVDSESSTSSLPIEARGDPQRDSAIEIQKLPARAAVQQAPTTIYPERAEFVDTSAPASPLSLNENTEEAIPRVPHFTAQNNVPMVGQPSPRHRPTLPDIVPTPWAPRHTNTNLIYYGLPSHLQRRQTHMPLDVTEEDFFRSRRARRHNHNIHDGTRISTQVKRPSSRSQTRRGFMFGHHTRRQPIARKWSTLRKRLTATTACINTGFAGYVIGVYAGEVPRIQFQVVDPDHYIILGNVMLFLGLAFTTFFSWPLPMLHGRKTYTVGAFAIVLPLQFPQGIVVGSVRPPDDQTSRVGLLLARLFTGLALGFANVNFVTTLLDLFGASLQSSNPHQELVILDDARRQGGGMGIWLGIWSWCFIGSIALGFLTGAGIIAHLNPQWGFYITCIIGAVVLVLNVITPETRRSPYRRSFTEFIDEDEKVRRRIARGEVKLHLDTEGSMWWGEEVCAGIKLNFKMLFQRGFFVLAFYLGWTYALVVLVIVLLGSLLSREYHWRPQHVGLGVFAVAVGAFLAVPLSKASLFSRDRVKGPRTDSMTFERQVTWSSHMVRRIMFMLMLPLAGVAYTLSSPSSAVHSSLPIVFAGFIGFLSNLAIAECVGLIMETFDTSDLQPGVNSRHRLKSMASNVKRRRTNYSSFPRVTSGIFVSQSIGFLLAAAATGVGGVMTRTLSSQKATAITAANLMFLTILLTLVLWRFRKVQVVPNHAFGTRRNTFEWGEEEDEYWKPVVIGNPSGKMRRMSILELGKMSRWTEIRILNKLVPLQNRSEDERHWVGG